MASMKDVLVSTAKVAPVAMASFWSNMTPSELAGFITAVLGAIYGLMMIGYTLRKWQREEREHEAALIALAKRSRRRVTVQVAQPAVVVALPTEVVVPVAADPLAAMEQGK